MDSHGIQLLTNYLDQIYFGDIDPGAAGSVVSETGALLLYDGANGLGQVVADICCGHAIRLANDHGIGFVVARESNHFGSAAFWAQRMSAAGLLGLVFCNASPIVPPWQAKNRALARIRFAWRYRKVRRPVPVRMNHGCSTWRQRQ